MKSGRITTGHPVDVASGEVYQELEDGRCPGLIDLVWKRRYSTALLDQDPGFWGPGWASPFQTYLVEDLDGFSLRDALGYLDSFEDPTSLLASGQRLVNPANGRMIERVGSTFQIWMQEEEDTWTWIFSLADSSKGRYRLSSIRSSDGHRLELTYAQNRLVEILQVREKRGYRLSYNVAGDRLDRVTQVREGQVQRVVAQYAYDEQGRLSSAKVAGQSEGRYRYDSKHRLVSEQTPLGCTFHFEYDPEGRCVHTYGPDRFVQRQLLYSPFKTIVRDSEQQETCYEWNESFQITRITTPKRNSYSSSYDALGRLIQRVDALGHVESRVYNDHGLLTSFRDRDGSTTQNTYDENHRLRETVYSDGSRWNFEYDVLGRLIKLSGPLGVEKHYVYSLDGDLLEYRNGNGNLWQLRYDTYGNVVEQVDPSGQRMVCQYDPLDRLALLVHQEGQQTVVAYDEADQISKVTWPDGSQSAYLYDESGNLIQGDEDESGRYRFEYGNCGRIKAQIDPQGGITRFQWGREPDQLLSMTDPLGQIYTWEYDEEGNILAETPFQGGTTSYDLDACGQVVGWTDPKGERVSLLLDPLGQILEKQIAGQALLHYGYDAMGRILWGTNQHGTVRLERDALGRVTRESFRDFWVETRYDGVGNPVQVDSSLGQHYSFEYDGPDFVSRFATAQGSVSLSYDAFNRETLRHFSSGASLRQVGQMGRILSQKLLTPTNQETIDRTWFYSPRGALTVEQDRRWGGRTYSLDASLRVTASRKERGRNETFAYDLNNNIVQASRDNQSSRINYQQGMLKQVDGWAYQSDAKGNLEAIALDDGTGLTQMVQLHWDEHEQLTGVTRGDQVWTYAYDAFGRRFRKEGPGLVQEFFWNGSVLAHDRVGERQRDWVYEPGSFVPFAVEQDKQLLFCISDQVGLVRELVDLQGQVVWSGDYLVWGQLDRQLESCDWPMRFQGQWYDPESGLHYNRHRYYHAETGRYLTPDPLDVDSDVNLYSYPANPLIWTDPLGLLKSYEIARMGSSAHQNDGRDAHELLQSAWLRHNVGRRRSNPYTGRGSGFGLDNPAIALTPRIHRQVSAAQRAARLHQASTLRAQTARQNINLNARILRTVMLRNGVSPAKTAAVIRQLKREANAFAAANRCR